MKTVLKCSTEWGFPGGVSAKENPLADEKTQRCRFDPGQKIPWSRAWLPLQYSGLGSPMYRGTLGGSSP